jgi:hypothetical protein
MSVTDAGLPNRVERGGGGWNACDVKLFTPGSKISFTDTDGMWLKTGYLLPWESKYSGLLGNFKGMCVKDLPAPVATTNYNTCNHGNLYYVGGNYHLVGGNNSGAKTVKYGTTMAFGNDRSADAKLADFSGFRGSMLMTGGVVVIGGSSSGSNPGLAASTNNGAYAAVTGPSGAVNFDHMDSNLAGTLGVTIQASQPASSAQFWTTTNGTTFTQRTGAGGNAGTINGIHWFPCAAAFMFIVGTTTMNKTTDGFTQTAVTLPSLGSAVLPVTSDYGKTKVGHSATASVMILSDGRLLRTTDGNSFTIIDITNLEGYEWTTTNASLRISHDGTRFVIWANSNISNKPMFFYSEDDGVTWKCSWAYENYESVSQNITTYALQKANSKLFLIGASLGGAEIGRSWDVTGLVGSSVVPDKVGSVKKLGPVSQAEMTYHTKVA